MGGYQSLMLVTSGRFPLNWNKLQIHFYTFEWGLFESVVFCNFLEENYHLFSKLCIPVVPRCHLNFFICSDWCSAKREHREHIMCQVVTCERLKAKLSDQRAGCGYL